MPGKDDETTFEGYEPSTLFREFAAECIGLAQTASSCEKHALYLKMASVASDGAALGKENLAAHLFAEQFPTQHNNATRFAPLPLWHTDLITVVIGLTILFKCLGR